MPKAIVAFLLLYSSVFVGSCSQGRGTCLFYILTQEKVFQLRAPRYHTLLHHLIHFPHLHINPLEHYTPSPLPLPTHQTTLLPLSTTRLLRPCQHRRSIHIPSLRIMFLARSRRRGAWYGRAERTPNHTFFRRNDDVGWYVIQRWFLDCWGWRRGSWVWKCGS